MPSPIGRTNRNSRAGNLRRDRAKNALRIMGIANPTPAQINAHLHGRSVLISNNPSRNIKNRPNPAKERSSIGTRLKRDFIDANPKQRDAAINSLKLGGIAKPSVLQIYREVLRQRKTTGRLKGRRIIETRVKRNLRRNLGREPTEAELKAVLKRALPANPFNEITKGKYKK